MILHLWRSFLIVLIALISTKRLTDSLGLAKSVHRAVVRTGSSIIDKSDIRMTKGCSIATLRQGPDVELFTHPGALTRLGFWLTDVLRDRIQGSSMSRRSRHKSIPLLIGCHNERAKTYMVIGINAALDFGNVLKKFVFFSSFRSICLTCFSKMLICGMQRVWTHVCRGKG